LAIALSHAWKTGLGGGGGGGGEVATETNLTTHPLYCFHELSEYLTRRLNRLITTTTHHHYHHHHHENDGLIGDNIRQLMELLSWRAQREERDRDQGEENDDHRSMIFVKTRFGARCLYDYLSATTQWKGRCGLMMGLASQPGPALFGVRNFRRALEDFKEGKIEVIGRGGWKGLGRSSTSS